MKMSHKVPSQKEKYEMPLQNTAIDLHMLLQNCIYDFTTSIEALVNGERMTLFLQINIIQNLCRVKL